MKYKITDIEMSGNEAGRLAPDIIYCCLRTLEGDLVISATLQYVLKRIRSSNLDVEGVTNGIKGTQTFVSLDLYS